MKYTSTFILMLALIFINPFTSSVTANQTETAIKADNYEGIVILKVNPLSQDDIVKLEEAIALDKNLDLDYSCAQSNVLISKFHNSKFRSGSDNSSKIQNKIKDTLPDRSIEVLSVEVSPSGGLEKC